MSLRKSSAQEKFHKPHRSVCYWGKRALVCWKPTGSGDSRGGSKLLGSGYLLTHGLASTHPGGLLCQNFETSFTVFTKS